METKPAVSPAKTRASLIAAAIFSAVFTVYFIFFNGGNSAPSDGGGAFASYLAAIGDFLMFTFLILALMGSPIGTYRGCSLLRFTKPVTVALTLVSFFPPVGLVIHLVLLAKIGKLPKEA